MLLRNFSGALVRRARLTNTWGWKRTESGLIGASELSSMEPGCESNCDSCLSYVLNPGVQLLACCALRSCNTVCKEDIKLDFVSEGKFFGDCLKDLRLRVAPVLSAATRWAHSGET